MTTLQIEHRRAAALQIEGRKLFGYAAKFNDPTRIGDFTEVIAPGAFARSLRENADIIALVDHDATKVLGRTKTRTLRLFEDDKGLRFELDLPDTSTARDVLALVERGDIAGMSFGFTVSERGQRWQGTKRTLTDVDLAEISVASSWPAYTGTEIHARTRPTAVRNQYQRRIAILELGGR